MKHPLILLNRLVLLLTFPVAIYYVTTNIGETAKNGYLYLRPLTGFFNPEGYITSGGEPFLIFMLLYLGAGMLIRLITSLASYDDIEHKRVAREVSYNVGNIIDIATVYSLMNIGLTFDRVDSSLGTVVLIVSFLIVLIGSVAYKIMEVTNSVDNETDGGLALRKSVRSYLKTQSSYEDVKGRLTNSYKNLINESN